MYVRIWELNMDNICQDEQTTDGDRGRKERKH